MPTELIIALAGLVAVLTGAFRFILDLMKSRDKRTDEYEAERLKHQQKYAALLIERDKWQTRALNMRDKAREYRYKYMKCMEKCVEN